MNSLCTIIPYWVFFLFGFILEALKMIYFFPLLRTLISTYFVLFPKWNNWLKGSSLIMPKGSHWKLSFGMEDVGVWIRSRLELQLYPWGKCNHSYDLASLLAKIYILHQKFMGLKRDVLLCLDWYLTSLILSNKRDKFSFLNVSPISTSWCF